MKVRRMVVSISIVASSVLLICGGCNRKLNAPSSPLPAAACKDTVSHPPVQANNYFALDLYGQYKSEEGNILFSPFSISSALAMTYEGARGKTAEEMQRVFYFIPDDNERRTAYRDLFDEINKPDKNYLLKTANNLWPERTYSFYQSYFDITAQYYGSETTPMDFKGDPEGSRLTINGRVEDQTEGKITNLIPEGVIRGDTRLVLTNAIYFKATWLYPFLEDLTKEEDFTAGLGGTVRVQMMHQRLFDSAVEDYYGKARVLELPYEGREVSMFLFLPEPGAGAMAELEEALAWDKLESWFGARKAAPAGPRIELALPKFKYETAYDMGETLSDMGMPTAFRAADFSGMAPVAPGDLNISKVIHKAFIAVDENGTEAAAATAVIIFEAIIATPTVPFRVDHPFIFVVRESAKGTILFMGRVNYPSAD